MAGGIAGGGGFNQRRRFGGRMRIGVGIRAVIQQQLDDGSIAGTASRDHQRRSHVAGTRVDFGAVGQQEAGFFKSVAAHIRAVALASFAFVGIGALFQQPLERRRDRCRAPRT